MYYFVKNSGKETMAHRNPNIIKGTKQEMNIVKRTLPEKDTITLNINEKKVHPLAHDKKGAFSYIDSFNIIELKDASRISPPKKRVTPLVAFQYKKGTIKTMNVGDTLTLPEINGESLEIQAISKKVTKRGNTIIRAKLFDGSETRRDAIVITEGDSSTFFTVHASGKFYEGEVINGIGYFYSVSDMNKRIDHSKSDILRIPRKH